MDSKLGSGMSREGNQVDLPNFLLLAAAIIFGCYLRLRNIEADGLWLDEAFSVATSDPDNSFIDVWTRTLLDVHPPFYQILLWVFYKVFGYAEMSGRYLSAFFGGLLIPVMFLLGRQLFNSRVALVCAWLVAVNFYLVTYSQETRSYSVLVFLTAFSFVLFIVAVRRPSFFNVGCYAVVAAMLVNTHYFGFLPVAAQVVLFFLINGAQVFKVNLLSKFSVAALFVLLTLSPSVLYILNNLARKDFWVPEPKDDFFLDLFVLYFGNLSLSIIAAILIMLGLIGLARKGGGNVSLWILVVWATVCVLVPYLRSLYFQPVLTMRNLIIVLPIVLLLLGCGICSLKERVCVFSVFVVVFSFSMTPLFTELKPVFTFDNQLRPVSQMRNALKEMIDRCDGCLIYSPVAVEAEGYAKVLGYTVDVRNIGLLESDIGSSVQPLDFFIFVTRNVGEPDAYYMEKYGFELVRENKAGDSSSNEYRSSPR